MKLVLLQICFLIDSSLLTRIRTQQRLAALVGTNHKENSYEKDPDNIQKRSHIACVNNGPNPECLWVFEGEGVATRKFDGMVILIDDEGKVWKRYEWKNLGEQAPPSFRVVSHDEVTGKTVG